MSIKYASLNTLQQFQAEVDSRYLKKADVLSYTIKKQTTAESGFFATYQLFSVDTDSTETAVGAKINIPKDFLVKSATIETCETADVPVAGLVPGDKYIDFVVNTVDSSETASHIYLPVQDLVDIYTSGNGITVGADNVISVNIDSNNANGLAATANGLKLDTVVASTGGTGGSNGAMTAAQAEKLAGLDNYTEGDGIDITNREISAVVDSNNANGLSVGSDGLALAVASNSNAGALSAADHTLFKKSADRGIGTATGSGNVITGLSIDSATLDVVPNMGITALQASDFVEISAAEVTALWDGSQGE